MGVRLLRRLAVVLIGASMFAVGVGAAGVMAQAPANRIDSVAVEVASCGTFDGRLSVGVTLDGTNAMLGNSASGASYNVGSVFGAGTHTVGDRQYTNAPGTPANTILTITVILGSSSGLDDYDSQTISFNCTTGEVVDPTTLTVSPVSPTPTPAGTTGAVTVTLHIGNDGWFDETETATLNLFADLPGWSDPPHYVHMLPMTGNGYPGEVCHTTSWPAPWPGSDCTFLATVGDDFVFTVWPTVEVDAPVGLTQVIEVSLLGVGLPLSPTGSTVLEVSAAPTVTTSSTTTTAAETTTTAAETTTTAAETTTTAAETTTTSGSEVLGDTLTSSTTIAATTTDDTLPATGSREDLNRSALFGFALVLLGIVALAGAAVIGQRRQN